MDVLMPGMQAFAPNVWIIDGPDVRDFGVLFTTRMTVVKLASGSVWVDSPVPVPFEMLKRIPELGDVRYLVAATPRHVWRLSAWHTLFPQAQLWLPRASPALDFKLSFTNRHLARRSLEKLLSWDFDELIIAHGDCIEKDAKPFVEHAFHWLKR